MVARLRVLFAACLPALMVCAGLALSGCASTKTAKAGDDQLTDIYAQQKTSRFNWMGKKKQPPRVIDPEAGLDEYDAAVVLYNEKKYDQAVEEFKRIAKKYEYHPVEEDALFMVGECRYQQKLYPWAQDAYGALVTKFPSTRHLDKANKRVFNIATIWLNGSQVENKETGELLQVSAEEVDKPGTVKRNDPNPYPLAPNFFDRSRPTFDTAGRALKALKSVWMNDPTGPLADDALMLTAVYYTRKENYSEADHYFQLLRQEYPQSEFAQTAFVVGPQIKLASYDGAKYDARNLNEADALLRSTINLYPELPEREDLEKKRVLVRELGAERLWARAQYYEHRTKLKSAAIYYELILQDYPESNYRDKAVERLKALGAENWSGLLSEFPHRDPAPKPASSSLATVPWPWSKKPEEADEPQFFPGKKETQAPARIKVDGPRRTVDEKEAASDSDTTGRSQP